MRMDAASKRCGLERPNDENIRHFIIFPVTITKVFV